MKSQLKLKVLTGVTIIMGLIKNNIIMTIVFNPIVIYFMIAISIIAIYLRYKLTFWKRQGVTNLIFHTYNAFRNVIPLEDHKCVQKYGKIIGTYELIWPTLLIAEPELINNILVKNFHDFSSHRVWATPDQPIGKSLFLLTYDSWKESRSIISPAFTAYNLKKMKYIFDESIGSLMNHLEKQAISGETIDIKPYFEAYTMDMLTSAFFATKVDSANDPNNPVVAMSRHLFSGDLTLGQIVAIFSPKLAKLFGLRAINKQGGDFLMRLSAKIVEDRKNRSIKQRNDLIQYMVDAQNDALFDSINQNKPAFNRRRNSAPVILSTIQEGIKSSFIVGQNAKQKVGLTSEEIVHNTVMFFIAGFDTTTAALCHLTYCLSANPAVQEKLHLEIDGCIQGGEINNENLGKMIYLDACISESLRLIPPLPRIERKAVADCYLGNIFVPKNTYISIPTYAVHHDADNYENPEQYKPERFLPENKRNIKPGTYLPFADGPRNCVGMRFALMEIKFCVANILRKYKIESSFNSMFPEIYSGQPVAMPKRVLVKITPRNI